MQQLGVVQQPHNTTDLGAVTLRSPSLRFINDHLAVERKHAILDLGMPSSGNVEFFSSFACTLFVEDLFDSLVSLPPPGEDEGEQAYEARVEKSLAHPPDAGLDLIFAWDLVSYMHVDLIQALMNRLSSSCRTGTLLYLMTSTAPTMPRRPAIISLAPDSRVRYEASGPPEVPNPRYTPLKLERMIPGFRLLHSFLLGASLQEFLFTFE